MKEKPLKTRVLNSFRNVFKIYLLEKILLQLTQGKSSRSFWARFVPNDYKLKTYRTATRNGINYSLDIGDFVDWVIYFGFKDKGHDRLLALCKEGDVLFDIGTNVGMVLFQAAQKVGVKGYVYGFEPDTINYKRCMQNFSLNHFDNILVTNKGLGDKSAVVSMSTSIDGNRGMNRVVSSGENQAQITTLDVFVKEQSISKIDVIKIDVEGFELNVLKGGRKTLEQFHPKLFIELADDNLKEQNASCSALVEFVESLNYNVTDAATGEKIHSRMNFDNCHIDIICL